MALMDTIQDDFNDNFISTNWTKEGTSAEVLEQNGRVEISHTAAAEYNALITTAAADLTASYALVQVTDAGNQALTSHEVILGVRLDSNNAVWVTTTNNTLQAYKKVGGVQAQVGSSITYNSTAHSWRRIRESGGKLYWETSSDGINWSIRWSLTNPFAVTAVQGYIQSGNWQAEASGSYGYFDNFNVQPTIDSPAITHQYHFFNSSTFLGALSQEVISPFEYSQDINSSAARINVEVAISADVASQAIEPIMDEDGVNNILDEAGNIIYEERRPDVVGAGAGALIAENNIVKVYEISANNPTGLLVFNGWIESWEATIGSTDDTVTFTAVSRGIDLADFVLAGSPYVADQSQATSDSSDSTTVYGGTVYAQSFTVGVGVTNIGAIDLKLANSGGSDVQMHINLESSVPPSGFGTILATTVDKTIPAGSSAAVYKFTFSSPVSVTAGGVYFFYVYFTMGSSATIYYKNSNVYAGGSLYTMMGISPAIFYAQTQDLYFVTYSSAGATTVAFSSTDPTTMLTNSLDTYASQGGSVTYSGSSTTATGLSVTYTFNLATMLDAVNKFLELAPSDWYWFVDPASLVLYFKQTATTATHTFVRGQHIHGAIKFGGSVENARNTVYFSGGDTGSGDNLYLTEVNTAAVTSQGNRQRLQLISDGRVTLSATGTLIMDNFLDEHASIEYVCSVIISSYDYDITSILLGQTVSIVGNGNLLDYLLLQIVRVMRRGDNIEIQLGKLLDRQSDALKKALLDIDNLNTLNNPTAPS